MSSSPTRFPQASCLFPDKFFFLLHLSDDLVLSSNEGSHSYTFYGSLSLPIPSENDTGRKTERQAEEDTTYQRDIQTFPFLCASLWVTLYHRDAQTFFYLELGRTKYWSPPAKTNKEINITSSWSSLVCSFNLSAQHKWVIEYRRCLLCTWTLRSKWRIQHLPFSLKLSLCSVPQISWIPSVVFTFLVLNIISELT